MFCIIRSQSRVRMELEKDKPIKCAFLRICFVRDLREEYKIHPEFSIHGLYSTLIQLF